MTYVPATFEVAIYQGFGGNAFTRNATESRTHVRPYGRTDIGTYRLSEINIPFDLKKEAGIINRIAQPIRSLVKIETVSYFMYFSRLYTFEHY